MERKFEPRRRLNPVAVAARSRRILARRRLGWTYNEIGRAEGLTAERIGQIVRQCLDGSANAVDGSRGDCPAAPARFAERLTAASRESENLKAIDLAIKIMDRLERRRPAAALEPYGPKAMSAFAPLWTAPPANSCRTEAAAKLARTTRRTSGRAPTCR